MLIRPSEQEAVIPLDWVSEAFVYWWMEINSTKIQGSSILVKCLGAHDSWTCRHIHSKVKHKFLHLASSLSKNGAQHVRLLAFWNQHVPLLVYYSGLLKLLWLRKLLVLSGVQNKRRFCSRSRLFCHWVIRYSRSRGTWSDKGSYLEPLAGLHM